MTQKEQLKHARDLIRQKKYTAARDILKHINHPTAKGWLKKIQGLPDGGRQRGSGSMLTNVLLVLILLVLVGGGGYYFLVFQNNSGENPQAAFDFTASPTQPPTSTPTPIPTSTTVPRATIPPEWTPTFTLDPTQAQENYQATAFAQDATVGALSSARGVQLRGCLREEYDAWIQSADPFFPILATNVDNDMFARQVDSIDRRFEVVVTFPYPECTINLRRETLDLYALHIDLARAGSQQDWPRYGELAELIRDQRQEVETETARTAAQVVSD